MSPEDPTHIGRFQIGAWLGEGAFGTVYRAYDPQLDRPVAIKVPRTDKLKGPCAIKRFLGESKSAARLHHPHIVTVFDADQDGDQFFIASAFIEGGTLEAAIDRRRLDIRRAAEIVHDLAEALAYAHEMGIVHRDVKPANVMLDAKGRPYLMDFGLAFQLDSVDGDRAGAEGAGPGSPGHRNGKSTRAVGRAGTRSYMSPEQWQAGDVQGASDQYNLGALFYELLCGQTPFSGGGYEEILEFNAIHTEPPALRALEPSVPLDLEKICLKTLAKRPTDRYANCQELANDLRNWLEDRPVKIRPLGTREKLLRWARREPALVGAIGVAVLAILAVAVLGVTFGLMQNKVASDLKEANDEAERGKNLAIENEVKAKKNLASSLIDRGQVLCEQGEFSQGMTWMTDGLALASDSGASDLEHAARMGLGGWHCELHPLQSAAPHSEKWLALAFHPEGKTFVVGTEAENHRGEALVIDRKTRKILRRLRHDRPVRAVAYSPRGRLILTADEDGIVHLWESEGWTNDHSLRAGSLINCLSVSQDGKAIVIGCEDGTTRLWRFLNPLDAYDGEVPIFEEIRPTKQSSAVHAVAISPDGNTVVSGGRGELNGGEAWVWTALRGSIRLEPHRYPVHAAAISPDGSRILTGSGDLVQVQGEAQVWSASDGQLLQTLPHQAGVLVVAFSPSGDSFLTGGQDRMVRLWDTDSRQQLGQPLYHSKDVRLAAFQPAGDFVLTDSDDQIVRQWQLVAHHPVEAFTPPGFGLLTGAVPSPDGKQILLVGATLKGQGAAWLRDLAGNDGAGATLSVDEVVRSAAFSRGGALIALGCRNNRTYVWNPKTNEKYLLNSHAPDGTVESVAFSHDSHWLLTGSSDGSVILWDLDGREKHRHFTHHEKAAVHAVAFSPDGRRFVSCSKDGLAIVRSALSYELLHELKHPDAVLSVAFSPDGKYILTGYVGGAYLWETDTGAPCDLPFQHVTGVIQVAFHTDSAHGALVLTGGTDKTARLWDVATKKQIGPAFQHDGLVVATAFVPRDNQLLILTASVFGAARLWRVPEIVAGSTERISCWTQVITGVELKNDTGFHVLNDREWNDQRGALDALGGPPIPAPPLLSKSPRRTPGPALPPGKRPPDSNPPNRPDSADLQPRPRPNPVPKAAPLGDLPEEYFPPNMELFWKLKVKQFFGARVIRASAVEDELNNLLDKVGLLKRLKALGIDAKNDVDELAIGVPADGWAQKGILIATGRFDAKTIAGAAKKHADVKVARNGKPIIYQLKCPELGQTIFFAVEDPGILVASPDESALDDALKRRAEKKVAEQTREFQDLLRPVDRPHTLVMIGLKRGLKKTILMEWDWFEQRANSVDDLTATLDVADEIKLDVHLTVKDEKAAMELESVLSADVAYAHEVASFLKNTPGYTAIAPAIQSLQVTRNGRFLTVQNTATPGKDKVEQTDSERDAASIIQAKRLAAEGKIAQAIEMCDEIVAQERFANTDAAREARELKKKLQSRKK
jgi:WD40 repeat protein